MPGCQGRIDVNFLKPPGTVQSFEAGRYCLSADITLVQENKKNVIIIFPC